MKKMFLKEKNRLLTYSMMVEVTVEVTVGVTPRDCPFIVR